MTNTTEQPTENETKKTRGPYKKKASSRGGAREGGGRPKGTTNKISGQAILDAIAKHDGPFEEGLAQDYMRARLGDDRHLVAKYQQMILNKVVADKAEMDITTAGEPLKANFTFLPVELPDWKKSQ